MSALDSMESRHKLRAEDPYLISYHRALGIPQLFISLSAVSTLLLYALQMQPSDPTALIWFLSIIFSKFMAASFSPHKKKNLKKKIEKPDVKKQNVLFILDEDKTPKSSETKMFFRRFFQEKKIFFLIIHLFFLSGSCKTRTSDVVMSVLCCKLAETLDLKKIKQSTPECNETLHCNGKGKILHMIFFSTPG